MRFPEWARNDNKLRLKFMCQVMCLHVNPDATMGTLARKARIPYSTALRGQDVGRMTYRVATALAEAASGSGVRAIWLMAPDMLVLDENGEVVE